MDNLVLIGGALGLAGVFALMHRGEQKDVIDYNKRKTEKVQPFKKESSPLTAKIKAALGKGYVVKTLWYKNKPYWEYYPKEGSGIIWYAVYDKKAGIPKLWMGYNPKNLLNQIRYY